MFLLPYVSSRGSLLYYKLHTKVLGNTCLQSCIEKYYLHISTTINHLVSSWSEMEPRQGGEVELVVVVVVVVPDVCSHTLQGPVSRVPLYLQL